MAKKLTNLTEYWRGGVEQWECDNMGHMNVRFWMRRFYDSLVPFSNHIGLSSAFSPMAENTLSMRQTHLKFIKEAHVGAALYLQGGTHLISEKEIEYYAEIRHSKTHDLAATIITKLNYVNCKSGIQIALRDDIFAKANALRVEIPEYAKPRSINLNQAIAAHTLDWAKEKGFMRIGLMPVRASHCDVFGRFLPENYFGFISESVPNLTAHRNDDGGKNSNNQTENRPRIGGAVLENRFDYYEPPNAGDVLEIVSGVVALADKTRTLQHRIYNVLTQEAVCISHAIVANFDLDQRKAVSFSPEYRAKIEKNMISL